jgi:hypothetical protein
MKSLIKYIINNILFLVFIWPPLMLAAETRPVTVDDFPRAESDIAIELIVNEVGLGKFTHNRLPTPLDKQNVIRMNRDTLYSRVVLDLTNPATITMPEPDGRYMGLQLINQDHYTKIVTKPGAFEITKDYVGTRYAYVIIRTFVDGSDESDIKAANALQDKIKVQGGTGTLEIPNWNRDDAKMIRDALLVLASTVSDTSKYFGTPEEVTPIHQLLGSAFGWGGQPKQNAIYINETPASNDGNTPHSLTVKDVPVDAFWSISLYSSEGFFEKNDKDRYAVNDRTAKPNDDGSYTVNFGGCDDDGRVNCLPIMKGWNYIVRLYQPREEIIDGSWTFPSANPN